MKKQDSDATLPTYTDSPEPTSTQTDAITTDQLLTLVLSETLTRSRKIPPYWSNTYDPGESHREIWYWINRCAWRSSARF